MPRKILAPHKEQDGWRYVRVRKLPGGNKPGGLVTDSLEYFAELLVAYFDVPRLPEHRIISSRRVEEAVETADFLKLCADDGLTAQRSHVLKQWLVWSDFHSPSGVGDTLREAYYRYQAKTAPKPVASEPADSERYCFNCYYQDTPDMGEPCQSCMADEYRGGTADWTRPRWEPKR